MCQRAEIVQLRTQIKLYRQFRLCDKRKQNSLSIDSNAIVSIYAKDNAVTKQLNGAIHKYTKGKLDIDSEYNKALDKRIEETSRKVEAWEKLPEGHRRKKSVSEFNDNAIEYVIPPLDLRSSGE